MAVTSGLVGREAETGVLDDLFGEAAGGTSLMLLLGEIPVIRSTECWTALIRAELAPRAAAQQAWALDVDSLDTPAVEGFGYEKAYAFYRYGLAKLHTGRSDGTDGAPKQASRRATRLNALLPPRIAGASGRGRLGLSLLGDAGARPAPDYPFGLTAGLRKLDVPTRQAAAAIQSQHTPTTPGPRTN